MKRLILLLVVVLVTLPHVIGETPDDRHLLSACVVSYQFHSGPSAPMFLSEYVVKVEPNLVVSLWYRFNPGSSGVTRNFRLNAPQYQKLIDTLAGAGVLADRWKKLNATPTGASQESVSIEEPSGKSVEISSVLEPEPAARFRVVVEAVRGAVPMAAWIAKDRDQRAYEASGLTRKP